MMLNNIKKAVCIGMGIMIMSMLLVGCGNTDGGNKTESLKGKELKVATGIFAPFSYKDDNGKLVGFDEDLLDALSKNVVLHIKLQLRNMITCLCRSKMVNMILAWAKSV